MKSSAQAIALSLDRAPLAGAVLAGGALVAIPWLYPPCGGSLSFSGGHHCAQTFGVVEILAVAFTVLALGSHWLKRRAAKRLSGLSLALLAGAILAAPQQWGLGICRRADMACQDTAKWSQVAGAVALLGALGYLVTALLQAPSRLEKGLPADPWDQRKAPLEPGGPS